MWVLLWDFSRDTCNTKNEETNHCELVKSSLYSQSVVLAFIVAGSICVSVQPVNLFSVHSSPGNYCRQLFEMLLPIGRI